MLWKYRNPLFQFPTQNISRPYLHVTFIYNYIPYAIIVLNGEPKDFLQIQMDISHTILIPYFTTEFATFLL